MLLGLALPGPAWLAVAWLTPAVAGIALTLAALAVPRHLHDRGRHRRRLVRSPSSRRYRLGDPVEVVEPLMQLVLAAVALVALAVVVLRSPSLDLLGRNP